MRVAHLDRTRRGPTSSAWERCWCWRYERGRCAVVEAGGARRVSPRTRGARRTRGAHRGRADEHRQPPVREPQADLEGGRRGGGRGDRSNNANRNITLLRRTTIDQSVHAPPQTLPPTHTATAVVTHDEVVGLRDDRTGRRRRRRRRCAVASGLRHRAVRALRRCLLERDRARENTTDTRSRRRASSGGGVGWRSDITGHTRADAFSGAAAACAVAPALAAARDGTSAPATAARADVSLGGMC